jgi:acyl-CoA thioester hydrolase
MDRIQQPDGTIFTEVTLRYSDMDTLGHLNNAVYATFFEAGRVEHYHRVFQPVMAPQTDFVIVKLTIDFKAEARYPGVARIATRVLRVGGSSVTYGQDMTIDGKLVATSEGVCALFDTVRRKAIRMPEVMRQRVVGV